MFDTSRGEGYRSIRLAERRDAEPYPCHWCGQLTTLFDAEDFHVCRSCQNEEVQLGYDRMKVKYPNAGTDARNPGYFTTH